MLIQRILFGLYVLATLCGPARALAQIDYSTRHVWILQAGTDKVWASYIFAVRNPKKRLTPAKFNLILPKEMADWQLQEGLTPEQVKLGEDGSLQVERTFADEMTLIGVAFNVNASGGEAEMAVKIPFDVTEFFVLAPQGGLKLEAEGMNWQQNVPFAHQNFDALVGKDLKAGQELRMKVHNVPMGRRLYWWYGAIFAALLASLAVVLTWIRRSS